MSIQEQIQKDLVESMKAKNTDKSTVLRMVKTAITNEAIKVNKDVLNDDEILKILQKQVKQRKESIESYTQGNRPELAEKEKMELDILQQYLPAELSDDELKTIVASCISETNASSKADLGAVMKCCMAKTQGRADGKRVSALVASSLS